MGLWYGIGMIIVVAWFGLGLYLIMAWLGDPNEKTLHWSFALYLGIYILTSFGVGNLLTSFSSDNTEHKCDICGKNLKIGEGKHFPKKGKDCGCYCLCANCLPTVDTTKLEK